MVLSEWVGVAPPELAHREQQRVALQWHALQVSLDAFAILLGDGHAATTLPAR
jgi:hypothetical protein